MCSGGIAHLGRRRGHSCGRRLRWRRQDRHRGFPTLDRQPGDIKRSATKNGAGVHLGRHRKISRRRATTTATGKLTLASFDLRLEPGEHRSVQDADGLRIHLGRRKRPPRGCAISTAMVRPISQSFGPRLGLWYIVRLSNTQTGISYNSGRRHRHPRAGRLRRRR